MNPDNVNQENTELPKPESATTPAQVQPTMASTPDQTPQPLQQPGTTPPMPETPPKKSGGKLRLMLIIFIVVTLLSAVGVIGYLYLNTSDDSSDSTNLNQSTPTAQQKPVEKLTVGLAAGTPTSIYPEIGTGTVELNINLQIFDALVKYVDGNDIAPNLATAWVNTDSKTWEFDIKRDVKFHNGSVMTVDDVVFSINYFLNNAEFVGDAFTSTIETVEKVDDDTVRIKTKNPDPVLLNKLANALIIDDTGEGKPSPDNGTGAYTLKPGSEYDENGIDLVAFNEWHNGPVNGVQNITFKVYNDEDELASDLEKGTIDILDGSLPRETETYGEYTYNPLLLKNPKVNLLGMNHKLEGSPTLEKKFRQAIYYAIDVKEVIEAYNVEEGEPIGQFVPQEIAGYNPKIERYGHSQQKARELLEEINWDSEKDSVEFTYFFVAKNAAENIAEQLKEVGIKVILDEQTEGSVIGAKVFGEGKAQMWFIGETSNLYDASDVFSAQFESTAYYENETLNNKLAEANSIGDATSRIKALQEAAQILADDVAAIPLYSSVSKWHIRSDREYTYDIDWTSEFGVYFSELYETATSQ